MSGVGGIVQLDGSPVEGALLSRLASGLRNRGPQGVRVWSEGPVGLVHAHFWTTPEELGERQPVSAGDGHLWLAADARLDNRGELLTLLGDTLTSGTPTDAELILAAYDRWGDACPQRLIGDFAFLVWDAPRRRLFCARDPIGMRTLHYALEGQKLVVASSVSAVLLGLSSSPPVNERLLRDLLTWRFESWIDETPYRGVRRLPPSYALTAEREGLSARRYWTFGEGPALSFRHESEYFERFREILLESVRARLRSSEPIGILVSGGLDSSSVACAAERLLDTGEASASVRLYSCVFERTPEAGEREYAEAVALRCSRMPATFLPSDDCWGLREFGEDLGYPLDEPEVSVSRALTFRPARAAQADGCRILLMGTAADQVLGGEPYHTPIMLQDVPATRLAQEIPHFLRYSRLTLASLLAEAYLRPAAPASLRRLWRRLRSRPLDDATPRSSGDLLAPPGLHNRSSQASYRCLTEGSFLACLSSFDMAAQHLGIEWRFPFLDRRLIDFTLQLPARLRFRNGMIKLVLRQAMEGILPEKVRQRTRLVHFLDLVDRGLRDEERDRVKALLRKSQVVENGLLDHKEISNLWEAYWRGEVDAYEARRLSGFLCAEAWLRHRERQTRPCEQPGSHGASPAVTTTQEEHIGC